MRYTVVLAVLILELSLTLAVSLSIEHAAVSVPSDADFSKGFPKSPPTPSPSIPSPSSGDPTATLPGLSSSVGSALTTVNATSSAAGSESKNQDSIAMKTADTGVVTNWTNRTSVDWRAKNLLYSPKLAELYFNRSQPAISSTQPSRKSNLEGLDKMLSLMKPATCNNTPAPLTLPPDVLRGFKTRGDSFYDHSHGSAISKKEGSGAPAASYRWIQITIFLVVAQWALV
jgi:hypothetical protein